MINIMPLPSTHPTIRTSQARSATRAPEPVTAERVRQLALETGADDAAIVSLDDPQLVDETASLRPTPGPIRTGFAGRAAMTMSFAQTPREVAGATLIALGRNTTVRPGWLSKLLELSLAILPRWGRVRVMALVMRGMTKVA
jgi:hypothetical protein